MKNIFLLLSFFILFSCKNPQNDSSKIEDNKSLEIPKTKGLEIETSKLTCEAVIYKIIKSSNLDTKNQKTFFTQIDRIENNKITIHVYFENNLSDNPKVKQMVESTLAWLELDPNESTLYNTTADPDNPIRLNFDKTILESNNFFEICGIVKSLKSKSFEKNINYTTLPIDFDDYYSACVNPYDSIICNKKYPKYFYKENDDFAKLIGKNYHPTDYMYLPKLKDFQPVILCYTETDTESYDLIILNNNRVISTLEIGIMDGQSITQFNVSKDYIITLFKRKNSEEKNKKWKSYKINENGIILELK